MKKYNDFIKEVKHIDTREFNIGDTIKCIDNKQAESILTYLKTYIIIGMHYTNPIIVNDKGFKGAYDKKRFAIILKGQIDQYEDWEDQYEDWEDINEDIIHSFNVGDEVECINIDSALGITLYKKYKVEGVRNDTIRNDTIRITNDLNIKTDYMYYRFKLVKPMETDRYEDWEDINENIDTMEFNIGDTIKCIDNKQAMNLLTYLKTYIIVDMHPLGHPYIMDDRGIKQAYDKKRFALFKRLETDQYEDWDDINENVEYYEGQYGVLKNMGNGGYWGNGVEVEIIEINEIDNNIRIRRIDNDEKASLCNYDELEKYFEPHEDQPANDKYEDWEDINEDININDLKEGDKLICINATGVRDYLTLGKVYTYLGNYRNTSSAGPTITVNCDCFPANVRLDRFELVPVEIDKYEDWEDVNEKYYPGEMVQYIECINPDCKNKHNHHYAIEQLTLNNIYEVSNYDNGGDDTSIWLKDPIDKGDSRYYAICQFKKAELEPEDQYEDWDDINENNEYEFKVGDRVRINLKGNTELHDKLATISDIKPYLDNKDIVIYLDIDGGDKGMAYCYTKDYSKYLIPVSPVETDQYEDWDDVNENIDINGRDINVGDRVMYHDDGNYPEAHRKLGTVLYLYRDTVFVNLDDDIGNIHSRSNQHGATIGHGLAMEENCWEVIQSDEIDSYEEWDDVNENKNEYYVGQRFIFKSHNPHGGVYWKEGCTVEIAYIDDFNYLAIEKVGGDGRITKLGIKRAPEYLIPCDNNIDQYEDWD